MADLFLIRHGESEWNSRGLWTGWTDVDLAPAGKEQARQAAVHLKAFKLDEAHVSDLRRARQTLDEVLSGLGLSGKVPVFVSPAIKERNYGIYTGKNKWQVKEEVGDEQFNAIRRGWRTPIPDGETLEDVYNRAAPYFEAKILPTLKSGKSVIVAAHGNTLRALIKHLENVPDDDIHAVEVGTGEIVHYRIDGQGAVVSKEVLNQNQKKV
ncbi:2,3-diphosphoglycerate-dependent phosphoglycerate mutase [Patescibacteria group bacterium]|nr:2,3-diphosphoglycerate-dependent phosphoglycerate mutase [Patescibacteria group bacterium]